VLLEFEFAGVECLTFEEVRYFELRPGKADFFVHFV
jgi:hypothetical protein